MRKLDNFTSNLAVLLRAGEEDLENEFVVSGVRNKFFIQFEMGWKVLKELLRYEGKGVANTGSPREIIKAAFSVYDFIDEEKWLSMLKARNDMAHIYDGAAAQRLVRTILEEYIPAFVDMQNGIRRRYGNELEKMRY